MRTDEQKGGISINIEKLINERFDDDKVKLGLKIV